MIHVKGQILAKDVEGFEPGLATPCPICNTPDPTEYIGITEDDIMYYTILCTHCDYDMTIVDKNKEDMPPNFSITIGNITITEPTSYNENF